MYMKKLSENTGKTVLKIEERKDGVSVFFTDGTYLKLDADSYISGPRLYPDKDVSFQEYKVLESESFFFSAHAYLIKLLSSGKPYAKKKIKEKLMNVKHLSDKEAEEVISQGYAQGLINDDVYIADFVSDASDKGYSRDYIFNQLKFGGYKEERIIPILEQVDFSLVSHGAVEEAFTHARGRNQATRLQQVRDRLTKKGYSSYQISDLVHSYLLEHKDYQKDEKENEKKTLKEEMERIVSSLEQRGLEEKEIKDKTFSRLISRRYQIDDIIETWKERGK
jgi:SOS response regulatory protein OraA/RecX